MRREEFTVGRLIRSGSSNGAVTVLETEETGLVTWCKCATGAIPSAVAGYLKGCKLVNTTTGALYSNTGTTTSCTFSLLGAATVDPGAITLAMLAVAVAPSHIVVHAGKHTTVGSNATEALTVAGVAATDIVVATLQAKGSTPRTLVTTAPTLNTLTFVFSGDPSSDHIVSYVVYRATS